MRSKNKQLQVKHKRSGAELRPSGKVSINEYLVRYWYE